MPDAYQTFEKRLYERRVFSVNVDDKLIEGDTLTDFTAVVASTISPDVVESGETALDVAVYSTPFVNGELAGDDGHWLRFTCENGVEGEKYLVALRYSSDTETALETVVQVDVLPADVLHSVGGISDPPPPPPPPDPGAGL